MQARRWLELGAAAVAGALVPFAFAPFELYWLAPLCYAVLIYLWTGQTPRRAFLFGFVFGCASFGAGTYWTYIAINVFGGAHVAIAVFLTGGLTAILALYVGFAGYIAARWLRTSGGVAWLATVPAVWLLADWLRGWLFSGFGWLAPGYSQTGSWLMGYAPLFGGHGMTWLVLLSAGALVALVAPVTRGATLPLRARGMMEDVRDAAGGRARTRVAAAIVLAAAWGGGLVLSNIEWTQPTGRTLEVALVQGAIAQDTKHDPEQLPLTMTLYAELTERIVGADLVVWPEAAIPDFYERTRPYLAGAQRLVADGGGTLLTGITRLTPRPGDGVQNVLVALTPEPQWYVKRHLVPYGEYFPVPDFVRTWLKLHNLPYSDFDAGDAGQPPLDVAGEKIGVSICYEDVFGSEQLHYLPEATLLVNVSNDAWFGDSIAPHQHLQISQLRAAEVGRWIVRVTNTGVSAVVDQRGRVAATIPLFVEDVLEHTVPSYAGATPYSRLGNYPAVIGALLVLLAPFAARLRTSKARARARPRSIRRR